VRSRSSVLKKSVVLVSCLLVLVSATGCPTQLRDGHYRGVLKERGDSQITEQSVSVQLTPRQEHALTLQVKDIHRKILDDLTITLTRPAARKLTVLIPRFNSKPFFLEKTKKKGILQDSSCYGGTQHFQIEVCYSHEEFTLAVSQVTPSKLLLSLHGERTPGEPQFQIDPPATFTLDEAVALAFNKNFDSKMEYQRVGQAKRAARAAYLNLLPHVNYRQMATLIVPNPFMMAVFVGSFMPFLLPNRWMLAREAMYQSKAEEITYKLMNAALAVQIEDLGYLLIRDQNMYEVYASTLGRIEEFQKQFANNEVFKEISRELRSVSNLIKIDQIKLANTIKSEKRDLSQALGFENPNDQIQLTLDQEVTPIHLAGELDDKDIVPAALDQAQLLEFRQIDYLVDVARLQKKELIFDMFDGESDAKLGLGFALPEQVKLNTLKIEEIEIRKKKIENQIKRSAEDLVSDYNLRIKTLPLLREELNVELAKKEELYQHLSAILQSSSGVQNIPDITFKIYLHLGRVATLEELISGFRISRSKLHRMLGVGYYAKLSAEDRSDLSSNLKTALVLE